MGGSDRATTITPESIRAIIQEFISGRLQLKLDKLKENQREERARQLAAHESEIWLADAARRVSQIQQVTHAIKYSHPDARGSSLFSNGNTSAGNLLAGTHSLKDWLVPDVVGNAAALDVYKFLRLDLGGCTILDLSLVADPQLKEALSTDTEKAESWMQAFAGLAQPKDSLSSHTLSKQLFWPLEDGGYHLLAPLFPSSLVTHVWKTMREHRFSDEAKAAREARKNQEPWPCGYHEYPNVVVQKFGGTKPQNISQLNSERHGENYLLPSVPPNWQSRDIRAPLHTDSIFRSSFGKKRSVREALMDLRGYLTQVSGTNNLPIRQGRERRVQALFDVLLQYAAQLWQLEPGWSTHPDCHLNAEEQIWLDPYRASTDEAFAARRAQEDWKDAICQRFANWLNARLASGPDGLPMGEEEAREWGRLLEREMNTLHRELNHYE